MHEYLPVQFYVSKKTKVLWYIVGSLSVIGKVVDAYKYAISITALQRYGITYGPSKTPKDLSSPILSRRIYLSWKR